MAECLVLEKHSANTLLGEHVKDPLKFVDQTKVKDLHWLS